MIKPAKKKEPAKTTAHYCTESFQNSVLVGKQKRLDGGDDGADPATSDVTGLGSGLSYHGLAVLQ